MGHGERCEKIEMFFLSSGLAEAQKKNTHDDDDDDDDDYDDYSRTQIPPLGYGESPTIPVGKTISKRKE